MLKIKKMRLPTCAEYDALATAAKENSDIIHWCRIYSWCQDADYDLASLRAVRGFYSARYWNDYNATPRYVRVGFRPAVEILDSDILGPDGTIITVGTLYMDDMPVKVPQNPVWDGDILDYTPGAKLELREAVEDPDYQVKAIKVGNILITDRVLLRNISWDDLDKLDFCGNAHNKISEGETPMKNNTSVICLDDEVFGACTIACSQANEDKIRSFLSKRYPVWAAESEGVVGGTPWNNIVNAIRDMKELLGDENLRFLGGCTIARFPRQV